MEKVSFHMEGARRARIEAFAKLHGMSVAEAMRFVMDAGLEALARELNKVPLRHGATRGRMPAPTRRPDDGNAFEQ